MRLPYRPSLSSCLYPISAIPQCLEVAAERRIASLLAGSGRYCITMMSVEAFSCATDSADVQLKIERR